MHVENLIEELSDAYGLQVKLKFLRLYLCEIEYVVDHRYEILRVPLESHENLMQFGVALERGLGDHLAKQLSA